MFQLLRNYYAEVCRIIYITSGFGLTCLTRLLSLSLTTGFIVVFEAIILALLFFVLLISLYFACAITDSCYPVHSVVGTSTDWAIK